MIILKKKQNLLPSKEEPQKIITLKKEQNLLFSKCSAFDSFSFCTYFFNLNSAVFVDGGGGKNFLASGRRVGYPSTLVLRAQGTLATPLSEPTGSIKFQNRNQKMTIV